MDKYLRSHWEAARAPLVACLHYETAAVDHTRYRLNLTCEGVELHAVGKDECASSSAVGGGVVGGAVAGVVGLFSHKKKRDALEILPWDDVLGAAILPSVSGDITHAAIEFAVYACVAKGHSAKRVHSMNVTGSCPKSDASTEPVERMMAQWIFQYTGDDGLKKIPHLVTLIQTLADPRAFTRTTSNSTAKSSCLAPSGSICQTNLGLRRRKYLVYINPVGGAGRAKHTYKSQVKPLFQQSHIDCEVVVTEYQAHATEHVLSIPLDTYDCVVAIGGDGLLSEILQGIMKRDDWKRAIRQPLGIIPGGSGNGLSAALLAQSHEKSHVLNAAYALAKGTVHDLDIATMLNSHQEVMYSFLSLEWAFIADVDMESERFRMFGGLRFTISAVAKILGTHQAFAGKLRYLSSDNDVASPPKYHERNHGFDEERVPAFDCFASRPEQKVPHVTGEWRELVGDFHFFWGMNVSHAASDAHVAPGAGMDDGYFYLLCAPAPFSRIELAKLLLGLETGVQIHQKQVQLIRTRAFTLEVDNAADLVVVDGERFNGPHVQVEVHRAMGRVVCLPRSTSA